MTAGPRASTRALLAITAGVLAVHVLALRGAPPRVEWRTALPPSSTLAAIPARVVTPPSTAAPQPPSPSTPAAQPARAAIGPGKVQRTIAAPPAGARNAPAAPAPPAVRLPGSARWHYEVTASSRGRDVTGRAELHWRHNGDAFEAAMRVDVPPWPARTQTSAGSSGREGLAPRRFSDRARSEEAAHFDGGAGRIVFSTNRPAADLQAGAQDRLSVLLQLAGLLAAHPQRYPPGTTIALQTATTREAQEWLFTVDGEEDLALPGGPVRALKLSRAPARPYDTRVEAWFAPGGDYGPVRLRLTFPGGDWQDMQWSTTDKG